MVDADGGEGRVVVRSMTQNLCGEFGLQNFCASLCSHNALLINLLFTTKHSTLLHIQTLYSIAVNQYYLFLLIMIESRLVVMIRLRSVVLIRSRSVIMIRLRLIVIRFRSVVMILLLLANH